MHDHDPLPVPYFHLVFTLPQVLNPLIRQNRRILYTLWFQSASQTLLEFGQRRWGVQLGITAVLHTWSQTLLDHYHLHCVVSGGGFPAAGPARDTRSHTAPAGSTDRLPPRTPPVARLHTGYFPL
jgi:hypothetical protein